MIQYMAMHQVLFKTAIWTSAVISSAAALVAVMDPSLKVAIVVAVVAAIPGTVAATGVIVLGLLQRRDSKKLLADQKAMQVSVDGHMGKILAATEQKSIDLSIKSIELGRAEGRREGVEVTEDKLRPPTSES